MSNIVNLNEVPDIEQWLQDDKNVYVGRPSRWGNPHKFNQNNSRQEVVDLFREYALENKTIVESIGELRGKNLGCWCAPSLCHAEVLHQLAGNQPLYPKLKTKVEMDAQLGANMDRNALDSLSKEELINTILKMNQDFYKVTQTRLYYLEGNA